MRFSVLQPNLSHALDLIGAVTDRNSYQFSGQVLMETEDSRLKLTAADLDIGLSMVVWVGAKVDVAGAALMPAQTFKEVVGNFAEERIDAELDREHLALALKCGAALSHVKCFNPDEFPNVYEEAPAGLQLPAIDLLFAIQRTLYAASDQIIRPVLTGLNFEFEDNCLTVTGADGYRLATTQIMVEASGIHGEYIVPAHSLAVVAKALKDDPDKDVLVSLVEDHHLLFSIGNVVVAAQLIEGKFPDWRAILPSEYVTTALVYHEELERARKLAHTFGVGDAYRINVRLDREITVSGQNTERGDASHNLDAQRLDGEPVDFTISSQYLKDVPGEETVVIKYAGEGKPVVVTSEDEAWTCVIMPIQA